MLAGELVNGPVALIGPVVAERDGRLSRLLIGEVDARARAVAVVFGGRRYAARLTPQALVAPIERPPESLLTEEGRALLDRLGDEVRLRGFAVALPADAIPPGANRIEGETVTELDDGTTVREPLRPACVAPSCGTTVFKLPDQDG